MTINNDLLADTIIDRLNALIKDADVKKDISRLIEMRVECSDATLNHSTIQCNKSSLGFLGLLNGIVGSIEDGQFKGWGFITAVFDDDNKLVNFKRTGE